MKELLTATKFSQQLFRVNWFKSWRSELFVEAVWTWVGPKITIDQCHCGERIEPWRLMFSAFCHGLRPPPRYCRAVFNSVFWLVSCWLMAWLSNTTDSFLPIPNTASLRTTVLSFGQCAMLAIVTDSFLYYLPANCWFDSDKRFLSNLVRYLDKITCSFLET